MPRRRRRSGPIKSLLPQRNLLAQRLQHRLRPEGRHTVGRNLPGWGDHDGASHRCMVAVARGGRTDHDPLHWQLPDGRGEGLHDGGRLAVVLCWHWAAQFFILGGLRFRLGVGDERWVMRMMLGGITCGGRLYTLCDADMR